MTKTKIRELKRLYDKGIIDCVCLAHIAEVELFHHCKSKNIVLHIADYTGKQPDTVYEEPLIHRDETMIYYVSAYSGFPIRFILDIHAAVIEPDNTLHCIALCGDLAYLEQMHGKDSPEANAYRRGGWEAVQRLPIPGDTQTNMDSALRWTQEIIR